MDNITELKNNQLLDLKEQCKLDGINFDSMSKLLDAEKVKKLLKRTHYIQQTIDNEIVKSLDYENK